MPATSVTRWRVSGSQVSSRPIPFSTDCEFVMPEFATVPGALAFLEQLGSSAAIADEFERRKIRSKPGCPESCAVADFISESVGVFGVSVDGDEAFGCYHSDGGRFRHELPDCAHRFVIDFDSGEYPNLVEDHAVSVLEDERDAEEVE